MFYVDLFLEVTYLKRLVYDYTVASSHGDHGNSASVGS